MEILNKSATFNYEVLDKYQAGLVLLGHEVKAIKNGQMSLKGSYIAIKNSPTPEAYLIKSSVSLYKKAGPMPDYNPERPRKLLLTRQEINKLFAKLKQKDSTSACRRRDGLTLIPLSVYNKHNLIKLEFALVSPKKKFDKKESIKNREIDRQIQRALKF
ncbi:MAG: SsrA-binding protein SmpB [Candidatus Falkowbacteria bacterium]